MKKKIDFRSESGAALVLEAVIVYPIALVAVMFLILWGFTFLQRGYLQYCASQLSSYIAKVVVYPGYENIDVPFYSTETVSQLEGVNKAMDIHRPYRYFFGLDSEIKDIIKQSRETMVNQTLPGSGFLRADSGTEVYVPDDFDADYIYQSSQKNGYVCAISSKSGFARVYLAQNYVFADFLRILGIGGKRTTVYGDSLQYMSDSVEIVRITDWAYETINEVLNKVGIDFNLDKIKETLNKITKMSS